MCGCLAVDADGFPAGSALAEHVDRVRLSVDYLANPLTCFGEGGVIDGSEEDAALDAVAVGLEDGGDAGAAVVVADVVSK